MYIYALLARSEREDWTYDHEIVGTYASEEEAVLAARKLSRDVSYSCDSFLVTKHKLGEAAGYPHVAALWMRDTLLEDWKSVKREYQGAI